MTRKRTYAWGGSLRTGMYMAMIPLVGVIYIPIAWTWHHFFPQIGWPATLALSYLLLGLVIAIYTKIMRIRNETKDKSS